MEKNVKDGLLAGFLAGAIILLAVYGVALICFPLGITTPGGPDPWYCVDPAYSFILYLSFPVNLLTSDLSKVVYFAPLSLLLYSLLGMLLFSRANKPSSY